MKLVYTRTQLTAILFYTCLFLWSLTFTLVNTTVLFEQHNLYSQVWILLRFFLLIKILQDFSNCTLKEFLSIVGLLLFAELNHHYSRSEFIYPFLFFMAASRNVKVRSCVKAVFLAQAIVIIFMIFLSTFSIIDNTVYHRYGDSLNRYAFGFDHPNTFGMLLLQVCLLVFFLYGKYHKRLAMTIYICCFLFAYLGANSMTATILIVFCMSLNFFINLNDKRKFLGKRILLIGMKKGKYVFPLLFVFCLLIAVGKIQIPLSMPGTFQSRITQGRLYFSYYGLTPFGQALKFHDIILYTLDNAYVHLILGQGLFTTLFFIFMYYRLLKEAARQKEYGIISICIIYAILGISETGMIRFNYNFSMLFFFYIFWKKTRTISLKKSYIGISKNK